LIEKNRCRNQDRSPVHAAFVDWNFYSSMPVKLLATVRNFKTATCLGERQMQRPTRPVQREYPGEFSEK